MKRTYTSFAGASFARAARLTGLVAAALSLGAGAALAQARGDLLDVVMRDLALCAEIADGGARLACYDRVGDRAAGRQPRRVDGSGQALPPSDNPADRAFQPGQQPPYPGATYGGGPTPIIPGQPGYVPPPLPGAPPASPPPSAYYQPGDPRPLQPPPGGSPYPGQPYPSSAYPSTNNPPPPYPGSTYPGSAYPGTATAPRDIGPPPGAAIQPGAPPPPAAQSNVRANNPPQSGGLLPPVTFAIRQLRDRDYRWEVTVDITNNTNRTVSQAVVACAMSQGQSAVGDYNAVARGIPPGATVQAVAVGPETSRAYVDNATCRVLQPLP